MKSLKYSCLNDCENPHPSELKDMEYIFACALFIKPDGKKMIFVGYCKECVKNAIKLLDEIKIEHNLTCDDPYAFFSNQCCVYLTGKGASQIPGFMEQSDFF